MVATVRKVREENELVLYDPDGAELGAVPFPDHGHAGPFLNKDSQLIWTDNGGRVALLNVASRKVLRTFQAHPAPIRGETVSPDDKLLATLDADGNLKVWDLAGGAKADGPAIASPPALLTAGVPKLRATLKTPPNPMAFSADGTSLMTLGLDHLAFLDALTGKELHRETMDAKGILSALTSPRTARRWPFPELAATRTSPACWSCRAARPSPTSGTSSSSYRPPCPPTAQPWSTTTRQGSCSVTWLAARRRSRSRP